MPHLSSIPTVNTNATATKLGKPILTKTYKKINILVYADLHSNTQKRALLYNKTWDPSVSLPYRAKSRRFSNDVGQGAWGTTGPGWQVSLEKGDLRQQQSSLIPQPRVTVLFPELVWASVSSQGNNSSLSFCKWGPANQNQDLNRANKGRCKYYTASEEEETYPKLYGVLLKKPLAVWGFTGPWGAC